MHQPSGGKALYEVSLARQILQKDPLQCEFNPVAAMTQVIPLSRNREEEKRKALWWKFRSRLRYLNLGHRG